MPAANPNETTLNKFIAAVNEHPKSLTSLNEVMATFAPNAKVGITHYGPQFVGFGEVQRLFRQLFFSFPDLTFTEQPNNKRLFSADETTIGTQVILPDRTRVFGSQKELRIIRRRSRTSLLTRRG